MAVRLQLREVVPGDLPLFFEHMRDPLAVHMAAFTAKDPHDRAAFDAHWERILAAPGTLNRTIVVDGQVAGSIASYVGDVGLADAGGPEVTYWLGRAFWGRGIATAALAEFLTLQPQRPLYARAAADNHASLAVLRKCGFSVIGYDRGYANARAAEIDEVLLELP